MTNRRTIELNSGSSFAPLSSLSCYPDVLARYYCASCRELATQLPHRHQHSGSERCWPKRRYGAENSTQPCRSCTVNACTHLFWFLKGNRTHVDCFRRERASFSIFLQFPGSGDAASSTLAMPKCVVVKCSVSRGFS